MIWFVVVCVRVWHFDKAIKQQQQQQYHEIQTQCRTTHISVVWSSRRNEKARISLLKSHKHAITKEWVKVCADRCLLVCSTSTNNSSNNNNSGDGNNNHSTHLNWLYWKWAQLLTYTKRGINSEPQVFKCMRISNAWMYLCVYEHWQRQWLEVWMKWRKWPNTNNATAC